MKSKSAHGSRPWGIALLSVVGVTGYGAATMMPDAPAARAPANIELAPRFSKYVVTPERKLLNQSETLAIPWTMSVVGSRLVVVDVGSEKALHVIDRATGNLTRSFGDPGEGPGEFLAPWNLDPVAGSSSELWIYDAGLRRLSYVDLRDEFFAQERLGERSINVVSPEGDPTGLVHTNENQFVGPGIFKKGRLGVFDEAGMPVDHRGPIPKASRELPPRMRQVMYEGTVAAHPNHDRIAVASRYATRLEIFGSDGSLIAVAKNPIEIVPDPESTNAQGQFVQKAGTQMGYTGVAASRDYVFALFSGRTYAEARDEVGFGEQVHVFDWDGNLKAIVELDVAAASIAVDENATRLYTVEHDPVPMISEYDLGQTDLGTPR